MTFETDIKSEKQAVTTKEQATAPPSKAQLSGGFTFKNKLI